MRIVYFRLNVETRKQILKFHNKKKNALNGAKVHGTFKI